jgi:hypothetical protein
MTVGELIDQLLQADRGSRVLFLSEYADSDEAVEILEVVIPAFAWTHEQGSYAGRRYDVRYPGPAAQREPGYKQEFHSGRVVILSTGPTNLRFRSE